MATVGERVVYIENTIKKSSKRQALFAAISKYSIITYQACVHSESFLFISLIELKCRFLLTPSILFDACYSYLFYSLVFFSLQISYPSKPTLLDPDQQSAI